MPRRGQHDSSPGDARKPFSTDGGPEGRHAKTHDVRREEATRPKGPEPEEDFSADLAPADRDAPGGHQTESVPGADDKELHGKLPIAATELARLSVLEEGTQLEQGGTYVDLNDLARGPFSAIGGHVATRGSRIVAKRDTDYELWNRLVGQGREPEAERPDGA